MMLTKWKLHWVALLWLVLSLWPVLAQTSYPLGSNGRMGLGNRNGDFFVEQDDLSVKVPGGFVRINRDYDGQRWVFNRQWSGLGSPDYYRSSYPSIGTFLSCTVVDNISSCDTTASSGATVIADAPSAPDTKIDQARIPSDPGFGRDANGRPLAEGNAPEFIARKGVGFTKSSDGTSFTSAKHPRFVVRTQRVLVLPISAGPDAHPVTGRPGQGGVAVTEVAGYRWTDLSGQWIEYDNFGRITSYGDRNDVRVWLQYGSHGQVERVLDDNGRTVFTLLYSSNGSFVTEVRDHTPATGGPRRVQYQYDSDGHLRHVIDARGNTTTFEYGASGSTGSKLTRVTDAEGRVTEIAYGSTARISRITAPDKGATEFDYAYDKLKKEFSVNIKYPAVAGGQKIETFRFDQEGRPISQEVNGKTLMSTQGDGRSMTYVDERNGSTQVVRDNFDEISRITYADGSSRSYSYKAGSTDIQEAVDEAGVSRKINYDSHGNVLSFRLAAGRNEEQVTEFSYNSRGETEVVRRKGGVNPDGSTDVDMEVHFARDANGNVREMLDGEGKAWTYEYDSLGETTKAIDPLGHVWAYTYDANGNLLSEADPNGNTLHYAYDKTDRIVSATDARGKTSRAGYDEAGRATTLTDPYNASFVDRYDLAGQLVSRQDAAGLSASMSYDALGRLTRVVDGDGYETLLDYTGPDGADQGVNAVGKISYPTFQRQFRYDSRRRPTQQTELLSDDTLTSGAAFDPRGRLARLTDSNGHSQSFEHDGIGRITSVIDELGTTVKLGYDHRNNLVSLTDGRGKVSRMTYDRRDLLVSETNAAGQTTRYAYSDVGDLIEVQRPNGFRLSYAYDDAGRLKQRQSHRADGGLESTDGFDWDASDNLTGWQTDRAHATLAYDDADRLLSEAVTVDGVTLKRAYTYYPNNKVKTYTGPDGVTLSYTYNKNGELSELAIPGEGSISVTDWSWTVPKKVVFPGGTTQEMDRDGMGGLLRLRVKSPSQVSLFELENRYGKLRELSSRKVDGKTTRFEYDEAVQLVKSQPDFMAGTSETYTIDKAGNREKHSAISGAWSYDDANRLLARGNVSYEYDDAGNMTRKVDARLSEPMRTTRFRYDGYNRLVEVRDGVDAVLASYAYDPFDQRLVKDVSADAAARGATEIGKTLFLQGEEGLLAEANADGSLRRSYGWHPDHPYATYPLFQRAGSDYFYYHNDQMGTPWRVTNKDGAVVWSADDYSAFGTAKVAVDARIVQPWRLPGQYLDAETGLHYNLRRYYESDTGRYVSEDPIGFQGGTNVYAYAHHSPTNFYDPTGEFAPLVCLAVNYLRCVAACAAIDGVTSLILDPCGLDVKGILKDCAVDCVWSMLPIPNPCGRLGKWISTAIGVASAAEDAYGVYEAAKNSFPAETLVNTPSGLKRIDSLRPGDKVLAYAEWEDKTRVEPISDVMLSHREQTIVKITLDTGEVIEATGGHPVHTPSGWRSAQLLQAGGQLDVKGTEAALRTVGIASVSLRTENLPVYNLEVAESHTFYVGVDGVLVHNAKRGPKTDPNAPHNSKIREVADRIEAGGGKILSGGGRLKERLFRCPGGKKGGRRPDVHYRDKHGVERGVNVGRTDAAGNPIRREREALDDLNNHANLPTTFEPYD